MKRPRRELFIDTVIERSILKNNQIKILTDFTFIT